MTQESGAGPAPREDRVGEEALLATAYQELRRVAAAHLRRERPDHTLAPTGLVHEAWLRLGDATRASYSSPEHFCALASNVMRRVLVDHARKHEAAKRGPKARRVTLHEESAVVEPLAFDLLALDEALEELARLDLRQARVVELRFFGGLTLEEVAALLGRARSVVAEDWRMARAFLSWRLGGK
jgi:RNA polymerase sigma factor (TIGR02999 family)